MPGNLFALIIRIVHSFFFLYLQFESDGHEELLRVSAASVPSLNKDIVGYGMGMKASRHSRHAFTERPWT